ncbi:MAG TPA: BON domain-containing protein [Xanthomonadaceae bacterium]|nr:BON domain-containing protein [Xanthomonadaceae bacterium]
MKTLLRIAAAAATGALVMYFLDPDRGRRRRALVRDRAVSAGGEVGDFARVKSRRVADRTRGLVARTREHFSHEPLSDDRLQARIRSQLGRLVEHPHAVEVKVQNGRVVLSGNAHADEIDALVDAVEAMRGVEAVDSRLHPAEPAATTH